MSFPSAEPSTACTHHLERPSTRTCDRCKRPFCSDCLVPLQGQTLCSVCKHIALSANFRSHNILVATPRPSAPVPPTTVSQPTAAPPLPDLEAPIPGLPPVPAAYAPAPAPPPPLESNCSLHEGQLAAAVCERCGDFICLLCLTPFEGRSYCVRCFELLWGRGQLDPRHRRKKLYEDPAAALGAAALAWGTCFVPFVSAVPAIGACVIAGIAIGKHGKELTRGEWVTAISAIVFGVTGLGFSIWTWVRIFH